VIDQARHLYFHIKLFYQFVLSVDKFQPTHCCSALKLNNILFYFYYRAMHFSAKRGIAIACRLSVRPSVRPSVCDVGEL